MATEKTDVVIIGVGAAGGILAAELGKAGMKVIGLERGPRLKTADFEPHDELRYFQRQDLRPLIRSAIRSRGGQIRIRRLDRSIRSQNNGNQAGGGTVHYGSLCHGACTRTTSACEPRLSSATARTLFRRTHHWSIGP